jgi:hypothetical protein
VLLSATSPPLPTSRWSKLDLLRELCGASPEGPRWIVVKRSTMTTPGTTTFSRGWPTRPLGFLRLMNGTQLNCLQRPRTTLTGCANLTATHHRRETPVLRKGLEVSLRRGTHRCRQGCVTSFWAPPPPTPAVTKPQIGTTGGPILITFPSGTATQLL